MQNLKCLTQKKKYNAVENLQYADMSVFFFSLFLFVYKNKIDFIPKNLQHEINYTKDLKEYV